MSVDTHGYDFWSSENMAYTSISCVTKYSCKIIYNFMVNNLWDELSTDFKESANPDSFKQNYMYPKG